MRTSKKYLDHSRNQSLIQKNHFWYSQYSNRPVNTKHQALLASGQKRFNIRPYSSKPKRSQKSRKKKMQRKWAYKPQKVKKINPRVY